MVSSGVRTIAVFIQHWLRWHQSIYGALDREYIPEFTICIWESNKSLLLLVRKKFPKKSYFKINLNWEDGGVMENYIRCSTSEVQQTAVSAPPWLWDGNLAYVAAFWASTAQAVEWVLYIQSSQYDKYSGKRQLMAENKLFQLTNPGFSWSLWGNQGRNFTVASRTPSRAGEMKAHALASWTAHSLSLLFFLSLSFSFSFS